MKYLSSIDDAQTFKSKKDLLPIKTSCCQDFINNNFRGTLISIKA